LGGTLARRLEFWPTTGRARIKLVNKKVETQKLDESGSDLELF